MWEDLTGNIYNDWTVLKEGITVHNQPRWVCRCKCGNIREVAKTHLIRGKSTGCLGCSGKKKSESRRRLRKSERGKWLYKSGLQEKHWTQTRQEQYDLQKGICPICNKNLPIKPTEWCWDHDHDTDECRELIHRGCNVFIGRIENDPEIVNRTLEYLRKHSGQESVQRARHPDQRIRREGEIPLW